MGTRKPPHQTLTAAQRDAAAKTLRELATAIHATAGDARIHVDVVGDLAALLARLTLRLPIRWGEHASTRLADQLHKGTGRAVVAEELLRLQTLIAGAMRVRGEDSELGLAAAVAYRASQHILAALLAPTPNHRERTLGTADAHLAAAHTHLAKDRNHPTTS